MNHQQPIVYVVDDEPAVRKSVERLLRLAGHLVEGYSSSRDFVDEYEPDRLGCVVLDLVMPDIDGLRVQAELARAGSRLPIIFLSGHGDLPRGVKAMKDGAIDFLTKPVEEERLLSAVACALERNRCMVDEIEANARINERLERLTEREYEVMIHVVAGKLNKQIALDLGTVEKTIKVHRGRIMQKLGVDSVAALVRLTLSAGIKPAGTLAPQLA